MAADAGLSGELNLAAMPRLLAQADALVAGGRLDLGAVTRADSAGAALLLELSRRARARGIPLKITGANAQVRSLIEFFSLQEVLALT